MKYKIITAAAALTFWCALASANPIQDSVSQQNPPFTVTQLAQNEHEEHERAEAHQTKPEDWYQGQRGNWFREGNQWHWQGTGQGDEWYQGQRGHWYQERKGWQFHSDYLVCNNQCRNCRQGGYLPPNGEGKVDSANPGVCWSCDAKGHHCHWAKRPII